MTLSLKLILNQLKSLINMNKEYQTIETRNYQIIEKACQEAYENNLFFMLIGNPGYGKTDSFEKFASDNPNVFIKEIDKSMSPIDFYNEIIRTFGRQQDESNNIRKSITKATNLISRITTKSLFIIDEAGKFRPSMQESIREFRDKIQGNAGLIVAGPKSFHDNILSWQKDNKHGMLEMTSRLDDTIFLKKPDDKEMISICIANGIEDETLIEKFVSKSNEFRQLNKQIMNHWRRHGNSRSKAA